jgi:hypothetical protein
MPKLRKKQDIIPPNEVELGLMRLSEIKKLCKEKGIVASQKVDERRRRSKSKTELVNELLAILK